MILKRFHRPAWGALLTLALFTIFATVAAVHSNAAVTLPAGSAPPAKPISPGKPADADLPPAKQIIDRYIKAIGGEEKLRSRTSMLVEGRFQVPAQGMNGALTIHAAAPNLMHVEIQVEGMGKFRQGYDGKVGWTLNPIQGPTLMEDLSLVDLERQADFYSELNFEKNFKTVQTVGRTNFEDIACYEILLVPEKGSETTMYFDEATGLLVGLKTTAHMPQGEFPTTSRFEDYQEFDGIKMPTRMTIKQMGIQQVMLYEKVTSNTVDKSVFELPPPIKALLESPKESPRESPSESPEESPDDGHADPPPDRSSPPDSPEAEGS